METTHENSSQVFIDWFRIGLTSRHNSALTWQKSKVPFDYPKLVGSQTWNNVSAYKQILGESNDRLVIEVVLTIEGADYHHNAVYECQAYDIHSNARSHVYDSLSFEFKGK